MYFCPQTYILVVFPSLNHRSLLMRKTVLLLSSSIFVHFQNGASIFIIQFEPPLSSSFRRFISSLSVVWRRAVRVRAGFYGMMLISLCVIAERSGLWAAWRLLLSLLIALSLCLQKATRLAASQNLHTHTHLPLGLTTLNQESVVHCSLYVLHIKPQSSCRELFIPVSFFRLNEEPTLSKRICRDTLCRKYWTSLQSTFGVRDALDSGVSASQNQSGLCSQHYQYSNLVPEPHSEPC